MQKNKGFTLIELLVVIAIIGILASVVLASLNSARAKGADAAVKSNLANARAQAELYYDSNTNSYDNVCTGDAPDNVKGILDSVTGAVTAAGAASGTYCYDDADGWAAAVPLKAPTATGGAWCVDSTGFSGEIAAVLTADATACN